MRCRRFPVLPKLNEPYTDGYSQREICLQNPIKPPIVVAMLDSVASFLKKHHFPLSVSERSIVDSLLSDMKVGLENPENAFQDMISTWFLPPETTPKNASVIVIDAGGTNFRSCLVHFSADGVPCISEFRKTKMPGVECALTKKTFFSAIADNIAYLKDKAERIGFCFSYPMTITQDGDGIVRAFSKEIKADEVVGCAVGACLGEELTRRGWRSLKKISLLNDTVAALLAGAADIPCGVRYSSYVGFILGTGLNAAYIQPAGTFGKKSMQRQIVVCESGKAGGFMRSGFDCALDETLQHPGAYQLEKCCSGAYLGPLALVVLKAACADKLISADTAPFLASLAQLTLVELDRFLHAPYKAATDEGASVLHSCIQNEKDVEIIYELLDALIDRSAWYAANILTACVVQSGEGRCASSPVCVLCNGTTFFKTHHLRERAEGYLEALLTQERGLYYEIVSKTDDITVGTAIAAFV